MADDDINAELASGARIELRFDGKLCIHSRYCVLQAPEVFKANTPGEWLFPDALDAPALAAVARNCPSGAITYRAREPTLNEASPAVNLLRLRENGPYALHAELRIAGQAESALRRTLCRCGASQNKPFCDGSHAAIGFEATGEPPTQPHRTLPSRAGALEVTPLRDGPLELKGALELVSGTGRTIATALHCLLCRCGGSAAKPFCDGTHARNGFTDQTVQAARPAVHPEGEIPSLADWAGGRDKLRALTERFYEKVPSDPMLAPIFAGMDRQHAQHVADFVAEVFGGGALYSADGGSHVGMISKHLRRGITEEQRAHWVELMIETADEVGMPQDPEFRAAFTSYLDWGSRLAVINSAPGIDAPEGELPMPQWGWGAAQGPGLAGRSK
ncbi:MAG: iron-binding protein [Myxococcaceae bacterium]|nr:iron-binding protein [Myxococcaceae bacterium]